QTTTARFCRVCLSTYALTYPSLITSTLATLSITFLSLGFTLRLSTHLHTRATYPPHRDVPLPKHPQPSTPPTQAPRTSNLRTIWPTFECTPFAPSHSPNSVLNIANHRIAFAQPDDDLHLA
ncbi:hypothetical protein CMEL01_08284, partial [Colletotrichum melonis]